MQTYERIFGISAEMLQAARAAEWERLTMLGQDCQREVDGLKSGRDATPLSHEQQRRKVEIIHGFLAHDAEIRDLTEPWMARLQHLIGNASREKKLYQAYSHAGG